MLSSEKSEPPSGVNRPHVDYAALDRVVDVDEEPDVADHPPQHVLDTLRDWVNFE